MADNIYLLAFFPRLRGNETALNLISWDFKIALLYINLGNPPRGVIFTWSGFLISQSASFCEKVALKKKQQLESIDL